MTTKHQPHCNKITEPHIEYRPNPDRWRIMKRCCCGAVRQPSRWSVSYGNTERQRAILDSAKPEFVT